MPYRDLITFHRLQEANTGKVVSELSAINDEARAVISGVSSFLREQLGRALIAEVVTQRVSTYDWMTDDTTRGQGVWTYASERPVVQGPEDAELQLEGRLTKTRAEPGRLRYVAGYSRPDQVLSSPEQLENQFPTGTPSGMSDLSELPPTLPQDITEVAVNLTLHVLSERGDELGRRTTRTIGGQEVVTEGTDPAYIQRQLGRLSSHDRSHVHSSPTSTQPLTSS